MKIYFVIERWADKLELGFRPVGAWWISDSGFHAYYVPDVEAMGVDGIPRSKIQEEYVNVRVPSPETNWGFLFAFLGGDGPLMDRNGVFSVELDHEPIGEELFDIVRGGDFTVEEPASPEWARKEFWLSKQDIIP